MADVSLLETDTNLLRKAINLTKEIWIQVIRRVAVNRVANHRVNPDLATISLAPKVMIPNHGMHLTAVSLRFTVAGDTCR